MCLAAERNVAGNLEWLHNGLVCGNAGIEKLPCRIVVHCDRVLLSFFGHKGEFEAVHCAGVVRINGSGTTAFNRLDIGLEYCFLSSHMPIIMHENNGVKLDSLDINYVVW